MKRRYDEINLIGRSRTMNTVNEKIIQAIIEKANRVCPDSLALIGIYGSVATGDDYEKSDLDLLIFIEDEEGYKLGKGFILDDSKVGYDIYCTSRERLLSDAQCRHAHLSKLLDSQIVYVKNQAAYDELLGLREQARQFLASEERFQRVREAIDQAKIAYANVCLSDDLGQARLESEGVMHYLLNAVMLYHGTYFKRGIKRIFEELAVLPLEDTFANTMQKVVRCKDVDELRALLKQLILWVERHTRGEQKKEAPSAGLCGTYEELYSNWRNKVEEAASRGDTYSSYVNLCSMFGMLKEIGEGVEIGSFGGMEEFNADCLEENVRIFDRCLAQYEGVYEQAGIEVIRYADVDAFVEDYLSK